MSIKRRSTTWASQGTALALLAFLYFVDLFLPWSQGCFAPISPFQPARGPYSTGALHFLSPVCTAQTYGWGGAGTVAGVLVALLVLWEAARVARLEVGLGVGYRSLISAALAFGVFVFTVVNVAARLTWMHSYSGPLVYAGLFLWISLLLAVLIALAGAAHWRVWEANPPEPGGFGGSSASQESVSIPPQAAPPPPPGVCPSCGRANLEDSRFCSFCGTSLAPPPPGPGNPRSSSPAP